MTNLIFLIAMLWCAIVKSEAARILGVFPTPSVSHQVVFRPVMVELAKRGHEVVVIAPSQIFAMETPHPNLTLINVYEETTKWRQSLVTSIGQESYSYMQPITTLGILSRVIESQIQSVGVQNLIRDKNKKFDLIFHETWGRPAVGFSYLYKAPVIEFSSLAGYYDTYDGVGAVSHRLHYPFVSRRRLYNLTLWDKVTELRNQFLAEYAYKQLEELDNKILKNVFGPEIPDINELQKNIQMVFLNVHPIWDSNRPVPPNVIYLGGLHRNPEKELPTDLRSYLDGSKNGVIYMSFGSSIRPSLFSQKKLNMFINVLADLPYEVLMKWDKDELPRQPKNIRISKWFPQSDLLKHPKIKLFITQGGLQSTDEAIMAGVPLIALPMHGDQWFNAEQYVIYGIGVKLSMELLTEEILKEAIKTVMENKSYRENMVKLRSIITDQQQSSLERAVWWTEHVLRHGGATHMRAVTAHMHWTEYYMIDIVLLLLTIFLVLVMILYILIRLVFKKIQNMAFKVKKS